MYGLAYSWKPSTERQHAPMLTRQCEHGGRLNANGAGGAVLPDGGLDPAAVVAISHQQLTVIYCGSREVLFKS